MKTLLFTYKFLFLTLMTFPLALCSNDNDAEEQTPKEPLEITFTENFFTECNQIKTVQGVKMSMIAFTSDEIDPNSLQKDLIGECNDPSNNFDVEQRTDHSLNGEVRLGLYPDVLEIDLSGVQGRSKILLTIDDNCSIGCTNANLYQGSSIIKSISNQKVGEVEDLVFDISDNTTKVRIWSFEAFLYKVTIE